MQRSDKVEDNTCKNSTPDKLQYNIHQTHNYSHGQFDAIFWPYVKLLIQIINNTHTISCTCKVNFSPKLYTFLYSDFTISVYTITISFPADHFQDNLFSTSTACPNIKADAKYPTPHTIIKMQNFYNNLTTQGWGCFSAQLPN